MVGRLTIDLRGREARVDGRLVPLTRIEFDILAYLAAHPGWVSSADQLMEDVWGYRSLGDTRTVAVHVGNLRRKLGETKDDPRYLHTVRGAGYKIVDPATLEWTGGVPRAEASPGPLGPAFGQADASPTPRTPETSDSPAPGSPTLGSLEPRVASLSSDCRALLSVAALIEAPLDPLILAHVTGLPGEDLPPALDEAIREGILRRDADGTYDFADPSTRETLAGAHSERERFDLHARIAETFEAHSLQDPSSFLAPVAIHYARAAPLGFGPKGFDFSRRAGDEAWAGRRYTEAAGHYTRALSLIPCSGLEDRAKPCEAIRLHERVGDALARTASRRDAVRSFERAMSLLDPDDDMSRARLHRKMGAAWLDDLDPARASAALEAAERSLHARRDEDGPATDTPGRPARDHAWEQERLQVALQLMATAYFRGDGPTLSSMLEETRPLVERWGTPIQQAEFGTHYLENAFRRERYRVSADTVAYAREHWHRLHGLGDDSLAREAELQLGLALLWAGESDESYRRLTDCAELAAAARDGSHRVRAVTYLSMLHRLEGRVDQARGDAQRAVDEALAAHLPGYAAAGMATLSWAMRRAGDTPGAESLASQALELWRAPSAYPFEWLARWPLTAIAAERGRRVDALRHVKAMLSPNQQRLPDPLWEAMTAAVGGDATIGDEAASAEAGVTAGGVTPPGGDGSAAITAARPPATGSVEVLSRALDEATARGYC